MRNTLIDQQSLKFARKSVLALLAAGFGILPTIGCAADLDGGYAPLAFDEDGRPMTTALLNNEREFLFVIDTAAQVSAIGAPIIEKLSLAPDPENKTQLHGAGGVTMIDLYSIA